MSILKSLSSIHCKRLQTVIGAIKDKIYITEKKLLVLFVYYLLKLILVDEKLSGVLSRNILCEWHLTDLEI